MDCDDLLRRLTEYAEGATDAELCAEIERHLAACTPCEAVRRDLEQLSRACRSCDPPRLPDDARARIRKLVEG
jgi:RNA polymerase sigma-70 factor (ECF subfamily)